MKRTKLFIFSLLLAAVLAIVSIVPALAQDDTLVIWVISEQTEDLNTLGEQFEAEFGIALDVQEIGFGDIPVDLLNFGPSGEGPDIVFIAHSFLGNLVDNAALVPIDLTGMENLFEQSALDAFTYQNELWAIPYAWENIAFVRNTDLVPEAPTTWQEVRAISEELVESGASQYGFMLQSGDAYHSYPIVTAFGGYIFGETDEGTYDVTDIGLNSEGGLAAAQWISDMYADELMVPDVNDDVIFELFEDGELAMFVTGPWWSQRIINTGVPYSLDALPGAEGGEEAGRPFSGSWGFAISAYSEKQLLAETFLLDFLASQEAMELLLLSEEGEAMTRFPAFIPVDASADPNIAGFVAAGQSAIPMPQISEMGSVWASWVDALTLISTGADPVESFNTAVDQIEAALDLAASGRIATLVGTLQDEAGCGGEWDPGCEATLMEDQGDGIYTFTVTLPAGEYEYKVALNAGWDEAYPEGMVNLPLSLEEETEVTFTYDDNEKVITDSVSGG